MCMAATLATIKWQNASAAYGSRTSLVPLFVRGAAGASSMSLYYFAIFRLPLADVVCHPLHILYIVTVSVAVLSRGVSVRVLPSLRVLANFRFVSSPGRSKASVEMWRLHLSLSLCFVFRKLLVWERYFDEIQN